MTNYIGMDAHPSICVFSVVDDSGAEIGKGRRRLSVEFKKPWGFIFNFNSARAEILNLNSGKEKCRNLRRLREKVRHYFAQHPAETL